MRRCDGCRHRSVSRGPGCPWCGRPTGHALELYQPRHMARTSGWWGRLVERVLGRLTDWIDQLERAALVEVAR